MHMAMQMIELRLVVERHNNGLSKGLSSMDNGFSIIYYLSGLLFLFLLLGFETGLAAQIQNKIVDEPYISCAPDAMYVKWKTERTFTGNVSVKYAPNRSCYQVLVTNNQIELLVPHIDCQANRIRSLNPPGIIIESSVLISFHSQFITSVDRNYLIKCFHHRDHLPKRKTHLLSIPLEKGTPEIPSANRTTTNSSTQLSCSYDILAYPDGPPINTVAIGDSVFHQWKCENSKPNQCLVVTNCLLRTYDSQYPIIDENGCSIDKIIVPELEYMEKTKVGQSIQVFGLQQRPEVQFQCQLTLMDRQNGACPRPECSDPFEGKRSRRDLATFINQQDAEVLDVVSQQMEILPFGSTTYRNCKETTRIEKLLPEGTICVSRLSFGIVAISTLAVAVCTLVVVLISMYRRFHYRDVRLTTD